jgi:N-acetylglucosamine-6-phosphate deacetylase
MTEAPEISNRFDAEDIRKLREYNSLKHSKMTHKEILEDIRQGAESFMSEFSSYVAKKFIAIKIQNRR